MDAVAQHVADTATEILVSGEQVMNIAFSIPIEGNDLVAIPVPPFETQEEKEMSFGTAIGLARALGSRRLLVIVDTWMAILDADEVGPDGDLGAPPSERLDRQEALVLTDSTELGVKFYLLPYTRDEDGNPIPGEWEEHKETDGMMVDILTAFSASDDPPPEVLDELKLLGNLIAKWN